MVQYRLNWIDTKIYPKRIDMKVFVRILKHFVFNGKEKRTRLATCCNMSYHRLITYVNIMFLLRLVEVSTQKEKFIQISDYGRIVLYQLTKTDYHRQ